MSKAFTSEETPEALPAARAAPRVQAGEVRYVTPEGQAALRREAEALRGAMATAAGLPDAERDVRAADLRARLALVEGTLAAVTVLGPEAAPDGRVAFGTWVTVEDEDGRRTTWRIVGPDEVDPARGLVSAHAPVGRALLGRATGDEVEVERPGGTRLLTIVDVRRAPNSRQA
jgi:transcription elongation factor GreB